ncbi:MAG TPA: FAD/NAD(P)-binding protein [Gemmataceae bacterium]|nr:FAD/NAD(P)-binding protein [Gemmataceae bacterium]
MPVLLVVGGGLFGSLAAAYARSKGIEAVVFDPGLSGAASPAAAGLFKEAWAGKKLLPHFHAALPVLDRLYGLRHLTLTHDDGTRETFLFVPPSAILEPTPVREAVTTVGDGWLEAGGRRQEGWVYVAAGVWCEQFLPGLGVYGKAGAAFRFAGERVGRMRSLAPSRQAIAFVRDPGNTYFSDGTAERDYTPVHDRQTLDRAAAMGLTEAPVERFWGRRPYVPGGLAFRRLGERTWLATGGRKMGTILGAFCARRLVEEGLR